MVPPIPSQWLKETIVAANLIARAKNQIRPSVQELEGRYTPASLYAVGADAGGGPRVTVYNPNGSVKFDFFAYPTTFTGGVRVATGDVTGDGVEDIITAPGAGAGTGGLIKVFDGQTGALSFSFYPFGSTFTGGMSVAASDVNADGHSDIAVSGVPNGSISQETVYNAVGLGTLGSGPTQTGAQPTSMVPIALADVNGDGKADLITGSFNAQLYTTAVQVLNLQNSNILFAASAPPGAAAAPVFVAGGDLTGDGKAETIYTVRSGSGGATQIFVRNQAAGTTAQIANPYGGFTGAIRVATEDLNGDGRKDIVMGVGPGGGPRVVGVDYLNGTQYASFFAFNNPSDYDGIFVG